MMAHALPGGPAPRPWLVGYVAWVRTHMGAVAMSGLLSFAVPVTLFPGAISAMAAPTPSQVLQFAAWLILLALELWLLLLVVGYVLQRLDASLPAMRAATLAGACLAAAVPEFTNGRGYLLIEQGVTESTGSMHAYSFVCALVMALLFFAHLQQSRAREQAAERLAAAQVAHRQGRRRLVQARLQELQARIDPRLLFEMLEEVRQAYERDAARAEQLLDELVAFLRLALPRLRSASSSVERELQLARSYAQLRRIAGTHAIDARVDVEESVAPARFPPGVLLPLVDDALRARAGVCSLTARVVAGACEVTLRLPAAPSHATVTRVRTLLSELYGSATGLSLAAGPDGTTATISVPLERA